MKSVVAVFILAFVLSCNCHDEALVEFIHDFDVTVDEAKVANEKDLQYEASLNAEVAQNWDLYYGDENEVIHESTPAIDGSWSFDNHTYDVETESTYTGQLDWAHAKGKNDKGKDDRGKNPKGKNGDKGEIEYSKGVDAANLEDYHWNPKEGTGEFHHLVDVSGGKDFTMGDDNGEIDFTGGGGRVHNVDVKVDHDSFYFKKQKESESGGNIYVDHDGSQLFNIVDSHYSNKKETGRFKEGKSGDSDDSTSDDSTSDDSQGRRRGGDKAEWSKKESRYDYGEVEIGSEEGSIHTRDSYTSDFGKVKLGVKDLDLLRSFILATDAPLLKYLIVDILDQKLV